MPYKNKNKQKEAQHRSYIKNKNKVRRRSKKSRKDKQIMINEYKLKKGCKQCGYKKHPAALVFHHIDASKKDGNISYIIRSSSLQNLLNEIAKCEVMCQNCHHEFHNKSTTD